MTRDAEMLEKLVTFLADKGIVSQAKMANVMGVSLSDFLAVYSDKISDAIGDVEYEGKIEAFLNSECHEETHDGGTWRNWFRDVLVNLNEEGEGFCGKRPTGNSGWAWAMARAMHKAGLECGELISHDEDDDELSVDWTAQRTHFKAVARYIFNGHV